MRNIVLVGMDSVRADHCSCYGYHRETTPFLNKLARKGLKFDNPIISGLATPTSYFGIFTGNIPALGYDLIKPDSWKNALSRFKTLAEVLLKKGYKTYAFTLNPLLSRYYGFNKGFIYYYDGLDVDESNISESNKKHSLWWRIKKLYLLPLITGTRFGVHIVNLKNFLKGDIGYPQAEEWIDRLFSMKFEEPYFLWVFFVDPHHPYVPPKKYAKWGYYGTRRLLWLNYKMRRDPSKLSEKDREIIVNSYDGEILHVDSLIEQLWEHLKDTDPIFIVHSDHGDGLGEHGFFGHPPEHYEYLIRVPLIIYNADVKGVVKEPISLLRLAPTICELAWVKNEFPQPSLLENVEYMPPIVENKVKEGFRITVRDEEWKLIVNPDRGDELYNIKKDPMEQNNLIEDERDIAKELRVLAEKHLKTRLIQGKIGDSVRALKRLGKI